MENKCYIKKSLTKTKIKLSKNIKMKDLLSVINKKALPINQIDKRNVNFPIFDESSPSINLFSKYKYLDKRIRKNSDKNNSFNNSRYFIINNINNETCKNFYPKFYNNQDMIKKDSRYYLNRKSYNSINDKKNIMIYNTYINSRNVTNGNNININLFNNTVVHRSLTSFTNLKNFEYKRNNSHKKLYYYSIIKIQSFWRGYTLRKYIFEKIKYYHNQIKKIQRPYNKKKINQSVRSVRFNYINENNNNNLIHKRNLILYSIVIIINKINQICYNRYYNEFKKKLKLLNQINVRRKKYHQLKEVIQMINKKIIKKYFRVYKENVLIEKIKEKILAKKIKNLTISDLKIVDQKKFVKIKKVKRNNRNRHSSNSKSSFERSLGNSVHKIIASSMTPKKLNIHTVYINKTNKNFFTFINNEKNEIKNRKLMKIVEKIEKKHILKRKFESWKKSSNNK